MGNGKMKTIFAFVFCFLIGVDLVSGAIELPAEIVDVLRNLGQQCREETGVDPAIADQIRKAQLVDDPKAKCYLKCVMRQLNSMKEDGTLDIDLIEATLPDVIKSHGGMETIHKCKHIHEADLCETAYQLLVCFKKENPELAAMFE